MPDIKVRSMYAADLPRVLTIERMCFGAPLDSVRALERFVTLEKWSKYLHVDCLTNVGLVAELSGNVVGFLLFQVDWSRGTATVLRLAVMSQHRRRGVASRLLDSVRSGVNYRRKRLHWQGYALPEFDFLMLVPERDLISQLLLRARGFQCVRILKAIADASDDVYAFRSSLSPHTPAFLPRRSSFCEKPTP